MTTAQDAVNDFVESKILRTSAAIDLSSIQPDGWTFDDLRLLYEAILRGSRSGPELSFCVTREPQLSNNRKYCRFVIERKTIEVENVRFVAVRR